MRERPAWWWAVAQAMVMLPTVKVLLAVRGYRSTAALLARTSTPGARATPGAAVPLAVAITASAVSSVASRDPLRSRCLARSLTLWWLTRRRGHEVELLIGVAPPLAGVLRAHAWVEYGGIPLNDTADVRTRYAALPSPPERAD